MARKWPSTLSGWPLSLPAQQQSAAASLIKALAEPLECVPSLLRGRLRVDLNRHGELGMSQDCRTVADHQVLNVCVSVRRSWSQRELKILDLVSQLGDKLQQEVLVIVRNASCLNPGRDVSPVDGNVAREPSDVDVGELAERAYIFRRAVAALDIAPERRRVAGDRDWLCGVVDTSGRHVVLRKLVRDGPGPAAAHP
ncbi:hypothetical protein AB0E59_05880 [Lentzea sp. NPDC034063]|uniref:hypothetical protein n=1 Tax=unclassified Lentzea TaxID=2643253 RepID=UPI0033C70159